MFHITCHIILLLLEKTKSLGLNIDSHTNNLLSKCVSIRWKINYSSWVCISATRKTLTCVKAKDQIENWIVDLLGRVFFYGWNLGFKYLWCHFLSFYFRLLIVVIRIGPTVDFVPGLNDYISVVWWVPTCNSHFYRGVLSLRMINDRHQKEGE